MWYFLSQTVSLSVTDNYKPKTSLVVTDTMRNTDNRLALIIIFI